MCKSTLCLVVLVALVYIGHSLSIKSLIKWRDEEPATSDEQELTDEIRPQVEPQKGKISKVHRAISYRWRPTLPNLYNIKVQLDGEDNYVYVQVILPFSGKPELYAFQPNRTNKEPLGTFDAFKMDDLLLGGII